MKILDKLKYFVSAYKLKRFLNTKDIDEIIDATINFHGHGIYDRISMSQKRTEIQNLANLVKELNPSVIVEIGTRKGGTLFVWCRYTNAEIIVSIDLPGGIHGGGYPKEKQKLYKFFLSGKIGRQLHLIQENSHDSNTFSSLKRLLEDKEIDFLFIDGDHTYSGVKQDFLMYAPLVKKGGIIAFHDIIPNTTSHEDAFSIEVPIFWNEIKNDYYSLEIIESKDQKNMGIGVIYK